MDQAAIITNLKALLDRPADSHKYDYGHVLVIGGSAGMTGAPLLAARAALRTGAGLVTIASEAADLLQGQVLELMTYRLPADNEQATQAVTHFLRERKVSVLVIGPGLGTAAAAFIRRVVAHTTLPAVLDAGALTAFKDHTDELAMAARQNTGLILTPHAGEYRKLSHEPINKFAADHDVTVALKGHRTQVVSPQQTYENRTGNPGMATAGSGDVLSGVIAGLLAQGLEPFAAAAAGVYLHGLAGDLVAEVKTQPGMIAGDIIDFLPAAFRQ
jgi:ADP-dependent NAD(P)H-hydrate dehydratase / NAD(P)H-hydrate epimerase